MHSHVENFDGAWLRLFLYQGTHFRCVFQFSVLVADDEQPDMLVGLGNNHYQVHLNEQSMETNKDPSKDFTFSSASVAQAGEAQYKK